MKRLFLSFAFLSTVFFFSSLHSTPSRAELVVDITEGSLSPIPIAVVPFGVAEGGFFSGAGEKVRSFSQEIPKVVLADLERSGLFRAVDTRAFVQDGKSVHVAPRFSDWRVIQTQALVSGQIESVGGGKLKVQFRLFDVYAEKQLDGLVLTGNEKDWRRLAHKIADAIYKRLTGEDAYFDTQIVYVAYKKLSQPQSKRHVVTRLAVMDQDGANHQYLSAGDSIVLTPRFSPSMHQITYMDYGTKNEPRVYLMNTLTGKKQVMGHFQGMTFAPRFSPDGRQVIMSMSQFGNSSLYAMSLDNNAVRRLTSGPVIDTSPSYSPDGSQVVFNSDRGGNQQLYVMSASGGDIRRISYGSGRYAAPVWSPRGDLISFIKMDQGQFYLGIMRPDGSGERLLTQGYILDNPTWAPNGRVVMFYRQERADRHGRGGHSKLYTIDVTGYNERIVPTPEDAMGPAWSPLIP